MKKISIFSFWSFGVLLPIAALFFEMATHLCRQAFFDPIPTPLHVILVASVPLGNFYIWRRLKSPSFKPSHLDFFIIGTVISVSACYSIAFFPIVPIGLMMTIYFGLGLLPLAPLASLGIGIYLLKTMGRLRAGNQSFFGRSIWSAGGLCMIFCCVGGILWSGFASDGFFSHFLNNLIR